MKFNRSLAAAVALALLGACAAKSDAPSKDGPGPAEHPNIEPTNYNPGIHISGQVDIGVVSSF